MLALAVAGSDICVNSLIFYVIAIVSKKAVNRTVSFDK